MNPQVSNFESVAARYTAEFDREVDRLWFHKFAALLGGKPVPSKPSPVSVSGDVAYFLNGLCKIANLHAKSSKVRDESFGKHLTKSKSSNIKEALKMALENLSENREVSRYLSQHQKQFISVESSGLTTSQSEDRVTHRVFEGAKQNLSGIVTIKDESVYSSTNVEATLHDIPHASFIRAFAGTPLRSYFAPADARGGIHKWYTFIERGVCIAAGQTDSGSGRDNQACQYLAISSNNNSYVAMSLQNRSV